MPKLPTPIVDIRRSGDRTETELSWLHGRHSFWIGGRPYDPDNTHHGLLLVHNEDVIKPGTGFETHPHRDMEIVTWVLEGALVHQDSVGNSRSTPRDSPTCTVSWSSSTSPTTR